MWSRRRRRRLRPNRPGDGPPVILPPSGGPGDWRRGGGLVWLGLAAVVVVAGLFLLRPPFVEAFLENVRGDPPSGRESAEEIEFALGGEEGQGAAGERDPLDLAVDSLSRTVVQFGLRHDDFERGRIACLALSAGYARLGDRVVALARERARRETVAPARDAAFDSAMARAADADRLFDASGCPRP